jgi:uncharacterized protein with ParB-like and HNH nuclease domain
MAKRNRLTNNSDETDISALISGDSVFSIPYFQRAYKWKLERLHQLDKDILNIVDDTSDFHFLGAIIVHGRRSNPSDPDVYDVIDGQQRITTLFIYICAVVKFLCENGKHSDAAGLFLKYLVINRETNLPSNLKLHSSKHDRSQLNSVFADLLSDSVFKDKVGQFKIKYLPATGTEKGTLRNNYKSALRFLNSQYAEGGLDRIRSIYRAILESMSVVQIDVWDPTNGPKIFDSLNSRQEPMTIGDLIRNEIFSRVANEHPDFIEQIDQTHWQPFYKKFQQGGKNLFDSYFFPYGLVQDQNIKKSEVYNNLKSSWQILQNPEDIIKSLSEYQNAFLDITCGTDYQMHTENIKLWFNNLRNSNSPGSTYPFLMKLSNAIKKELILEDDAVEVLKVIESFLVRRAIYGIEPTGLHAVFKKLWGDCSEKPNGGAVIREIKKHKTVYWPTNEDMKNIIRARPLYGAGITKYVLLEHNKSLGGDCPSDMPWIEHILPQTPDPIWFNDFNKEQHEKMNGLLANLIPLSQQMNKEIGNGPYAKKRERYRNDSMYKSARILAERNEVWTPETIIKRSDEIYEWAIQRWKF